MTTGKKLDWLSNKSRPWIRLVVDIATIAVAFFAFVTWRETVDARKIGERAWVAPTGAIQLAGAPLAPGKAMPFWILYNNTGKEPALDLTYELIPDFKTVDGRVESGDWTTFDAGPNDTCAALRPGDGGPVVYPSPMGAYAAGFTIKDISKTTAMFNSQAVFVAKGCFKYRTVGDVKKAAFCFYLQPDKDSPPEKWIFKTCSGGSLAN